MTSFLNPDDPGVIANDLFGSAIASQGGASIIGAIGAGKVYIR
jgi:hypothetical protein